MKARVFFLLILVGRCLAMDNALGDSEKNVAVEHALLSPDRRYSVRLVEKDRLSRYLITDLQTGSVDESVVMPTVLLYLNWDSNSRSLVAVEHIPKGSCGRVIYSSNGRWRDVEVRPPTKDRIDSAVVSLKINLNRVHYRFAVRRVGGNGLPLSHSICDLDLDLGDGRTLNVKWSPITQAKEAEILKREPVYDPPMTAH